MASPLVSVIVPTYNRPELLAKALDSISGQTMQDFEVVIVNDHGQDVSGIIEAYPRDKFRYLSHIENRGLAASRNTGIAAARGKYIAYLDDDDIFYPAHLEVLTGFLEYSGMPAAYSDAVVAHVQNGDVVQREPFPSLDFDRNLILTKNILPVLCMVHQKSCIHEVGGFREDFRAHEDWELWIRLFEYFPVAHIKSITCEFKYSEQGSNITANRLEMLRTMLAIYRAHPLPAESDPRLAEFRSQMLIYVEKSCSGGSPDVNARILELYDHYEAYDEIIRLCSELMETGDKCEWAPPMARALKKQGRLSEAVQLLSAIG